MEQDWSIIAQHYGYISHPLTRLYLYMRVLRMCGDVVMLEACKFGNPLPLPTN